MRPFGIIVVLATFVAFFVGKWAQTVDSREISSAELVTEPQLATVSHSKQGAVNKKSPAGLKADAKATLEALAISDPSAALAKIHTFLLPSGTREHLYGHVFSVWAMSDPIAAGGFASRVEDPQLREVAIEGVASGWAKVDTGSALVWASGFSGNGSQRQRALAAVLVMGIEVDVKKTAELAVGLEGSDLWNLAVKPKSGFPPLTRVFQALGEKHPEHALKLFEMLPPKVLAKIFSFYPVWTPFRELLATDTDAALRMAESLPEGSKARGAVISDIALACTRTDPYRALELSEQLSARGKKFILEESLPRLPDQGAVARILITDPEYSSSRRLDQCMWRLASRDAAGADEALAILNEIPIEKRVNVRASTLAGVAKHDPARAMSLASGLDDNGAAEWGVMEVWSTMDPAGFRGWLDSASAEVRATGLVATGLAQMRDNPQAAAAVLAEAAQTGTDQFDAHNYRIKQAFADLADVLTKDDLSQAIDWLKSLQGAEVAVGAVERIARAALAVDAASASRWIAELAPGRGRDVAASLLVEGLLPTDPEAAFAWSTAITESESERERALGAAVPKFYQTNPDLAVARIAALDPGSLRDTAIDLVLSSFSADDTAGAFELGQLVVDESTRQGCLWRVVSKITTDERRKFIETLPESDPVRKTMLSPGFGDRFYYLFR